MQWEGGGGKSDFSGNEEKSGNGDKFSGFFATFE
jgi:hypothetical protein